MSEDLDPDERLMAELRDFFAAVDPIPPLLVETAKASLGWRRLDADLAELLSDSVLEEAPFALARGGGTPARAVTFSSSDLTIDIEVHVDDQGRTLLGQLSPAAAAAIEIDTMAEEPVSAQADHLGRFRTRLPAGGTIRLRVLRGEGHAAPPVETSWITV
ncbi:MAG TPA: hypothetical protein VMF57_09440 [Solirubrobacteraceae bacterium]|nr:hypothetical protein [Solirubrobacteraceae bacterium]